MSGHNTIDHKVNLVSLNHLKVNIMEYMLKTK